MLGIVFFSVSFLIACINEKEQRAALLTGALIASLIILELCSYWLYTMGVFSNPGGKLLLLTGWIGIGCGIYFFGRHTGTNGRALKGVDGYVVGNAKRYDEREQVFARERSIRPGSPEYEAFYRSHPELEQMDSERRSLGGLLGKPGAIDHPGGEPNVSAMEAFFSIPPHFGKTKNHSPAVKQFEGDRPVISPEEAAARVKAEATAEAEEKAKSYSEEIARVKAEAAETIAKQRAEFEEKVRLYAEAAAKAEERAKAEVEERARAEAQMVAAEKARSEAEERARLEAEDSDDED